MPQYSGAFFDRSEYMIRFNNVTKIYNNGVVGLKNIDLSIADGEFVVIIGSSGAGKSTLLRTINRLIDISQGDISINGKSVTQANPKELRRIRRNIGMIFQQFNLVKKNTVQKNVISGRLGYYSNLRTLFGLYSKEDYQKVNQALKLVGLEDKLKERSDSLSGGQQQRVSIARTIVQEADVILADEPVSALDPITAEVIMNDFQRLNIQEGKTIIVNLHSIELARKYASRIIGMKHGEIVFDGLPEEANDQKLKEIYGQKVFEKELTGDGV